MKVHELIELLKQLPPMGMILVEGYEGGYDEPKGVYPVVVIEDWDHKNYEGEYTDCWPMQDGERAYVISRKS